MTRQKIFIAEDDADVARGLRLALRQDFDVTVAMNFRAIKQEILESAADLVLMDIGLPFFSGFYWTAALRECSQLPIIFISAATDEMTQVSAMAAGADDFVTKPFRMAVLTAKVKALLRRTYSFAGVERLGFADYQLADHVVSATGGGAVALTASENKILVALFRAQGQLVSKNDLLQALWQTDEYIDANTLNVKMTRLRGKLSTIGLDSHIVTKRGQGYALV